MELLPKDLEIKIPELYTQEDSGDSAIAYIKIFTPDSNYTWFILEMDPLNQMCYGFVVGLHAELGYFSLQDLKEVRGIWGLPVERDLNFQPTSLAEIKRTINAWT